MVDKRPNPALKRRDINDEREKFSDIELDEARSNIKRAFELCGLAGANGQPVCPQCGKTGKSRIKFFSDGGYKCFSAEACYGRKFGAVDLIIERMGVTFPDAVAMILGRPISRRASEAKALPAPVVIVVEGNDFKATVDTEVFNAIANSGSVSKAAEYYGRFHIDADAVTEAGAFVIEDAAALQRSLIEQFDRDRLIACGVLLPQEEGRADMWAFSERYPVGEPHRHVDGNVLGLQFRLSIEYEKRHKAHRAYVAERQDAETRGETFRAPRFDEKYVPKFMSLKGNTPDHLVGCGLPRLAQLHRGSTVYVVEGFKDLLAMRTLGYEGYALPGAGTSPPKDVVRRLATFNLALAFDADEGGDIGGARLEAALARHGILTDDGVLPANAHEWAQRTVEFRKERQLRCYRKRPADGKDIADVLEEHVLTKAQGGCKCRACRNFRLHSR